LGKEVGHRGNLVGHSAAVMRSHGRISRSSDRASIVATILFMISIRSAWCSSSRYPRRHGAGAGSRGASEDGRHYTSVWMNSFSQTGKCRMLSVV
jgi:hypothetical protein